MKILEINTLGNFSLLLDGEPVPLTSKKAQALVVFLAAQPKGFSREYLATLFWNDRSQEQAMANLRVLLAALRKELGSYLWIGRQDIRIHPECNYRFDAAELERALNLNRKHWGYEAQYSPVHVEELEKILQAYQGDFLSGWSLRDAPGFEEWIELERERYKRLAIEGMLQLTDGYLALKRYEDGLRMCHTILRTDRLNEEANRQIMRLLTLTGQRNLALAHYDNYLAFLRETYQLEPEEATVQVYEQIRQGEIAAEPGSSAAIQPPLANPYKGLRAFQEDEAQDYFGREEIVAQLVQMAYQKKLVVILGPSGSGKTSLVQAGLIPILRNAHTSRAAERAHWHIADFRPGNNPVYALASTLYPLLVPSAPETTRIVEVNRLADHLRRGEITLTEIINTIVEKSHAAELKKRSRQVGSIPPERVLLVVNQFEEMYTACQSPEECNRFLDILLSGVNAGSNNDNPLVVIITLRADFMGQVLEYRPMADAIQGNTVILSHMSQEEMMRAIQEPAARYGVYYQAGLVNRILDDVGKSAGSLPLLEFALTILWENQSGNTITHQEYEAIGGVSGALTRYADQVLNELAPEERAKAPYIFSQLVKPGEGTEDTRRIATRWELGDENWAIIQKLADKRLIVTNQDENGQDTAELVHEALIRSWEALRTWMDANRTFRIWQEQLRSAARNWELSGQDESDLYQGARLQTALEMTQLNFAELSDWEKKFIVASVELAERREAESRRIQEQELIAAQQVANAERERAEVERMAARRLRSASRWLAFVTVFLLLAFGAAIVSSYQLNRTLGEREQFANNNATIAAENQKLAFEKATAAAESQLYAAEMEKIAIENQRLAAERSTAVVESQKIAATAVAQEQFAEQQRALAEEQQRIAEQAFNLAEAGRLALAAVQALQDERPPETVALLGLQSIRKHYTREGDAILQSALTFPFPRQVIGFKMAPMQIEFSPDRTLFLTGDLDGDVVLWDAGSLTPKYTIPAHADWVKAIRFSPDGSRYLTASQDSWLRIWDTATGALVYEYQHSAPLRDADFAHDRQSAFFSDNKAVTQLDLDSGQPVRTFGSDLTPANIQLVRVSPDGEKFFLGDDTGTIFILDARSGNLLYSQRAHSAPLTAVIFSEDGAHFATGTNNGEVIVWDTVLGTQQYVFSKHTGEISSLAFSLDGQYLVSGSRDQNIFIWNVSTGKFIMALHNHRDNVSDIAFTGQGNKFITTSQDLTMMRWDPFAPPALPQYIGKPAGVVGLAFSPDGSRLYGTGIDRSVLGWDTITGEQVIEFNQHLNPVQSIALTSDGRYALSGSWEEAPAALFWDTTTGKIIHAFSDCDSALAVAISHDDRFGAAAGWGGVIYLWDLQTGELVKRLTEHKAAVFALDFAPDGRLLSSGFDDTLRLYAPGSFEPTLTISFTHQSESDGYTGAVFSPDGKLIAAAHFNLGVYLYDAATGEELHEMLGHTSQVWSVAFSPDGTLLASASSDKTARLWKVADGTFLRSIGGHDAALNSALFSLDGQYLLTAGADDRVMTWDIQLEKTIQHLCSLLWRDLSRGELEQYGIPEENLPTCP